eukprot:3285258-Amphidinium_carterae.1
MTNGLCYLEVSFVAEFKSCQWVGRRWVASTKSVAGFHNCNEPIVLHFGPLKGGRGMSFRCSLMGFAACVYEVSALARDFESMLPAFGLVVEVLSSDL